MMDAPRSSNTPARYLIINADDFGRSSGVNRGIIEAHEHGVVTSASLMVRWPASAEAARYGRGHSRLDLGLHLDLGEWEYREDEWKCVYQVVDMTSADEVRAEIERQIRAFEDLVGRSPTHLDSHQHTHREAPVNLAVREAAERLDIPVREASVSYRGDFYGQDRFGLSHPEWVSVDGFVRALRRVEPGWTELSCHPSDSDDLASMYRMERMQELSTLCDPRARGAIDELHIRLASFEDWRKAAGLASDCE